MREIKVAVRALSRFEPLIGADRFADLRRAAALTRQRLEGRTIWNVSSTAAGGGVAEMLQVLVGYTLDADIDIRWLVMSADPEFFSITKRIHNRLHGAAGDTGGLGANETAHYEEITAANSKRVMRRVQPGDVVLLHDPQTAGMAPALAEAGARVVWRCHIGRAGSNQWTEEAWSFLRPHLAHCEAYIFSLPEYVPSWIEASKVRIIPPSIDPFSPKNQDMSPEQRASHARPHRSSPGSAERPSGNVHPRRWYRRVCRTPSNDRFRRRRSLGTWCPLGGPNIAMGPIEGHERRHGGVCCRGAGPG